MKEVLFKALEQMPMQFSSNEFTKKAKQLGVTQLQINRGIIANFLKLNAVRHEDSRRMYSKNRSNVDLFKQFHSDAMDIQKAIDLLKSNGYKIMKPVNEYVEI